MILWDINTGNKTLSIGTKDTEVFALQLTKDNLLLSGNALGVLALWNLSSGDIDNSAVNEGDAIFAIDADPMYVISGGGKGIIKIPKVPSTMPAIAIPLPP